MMAALRLLYTAFKFGVIYCLFLYAAFLLVKYFWGKEISGLKTVALTLLLTYCLLCLTYFVKGVLLGLHANKNGWWRVLWLLCVTATCLPSVVITHVLVILLYDFHSQQLLSTKLIAWGVGALVGLYTYSVYQFLTPVAPPLLSWSLVAGFRLMRKNEA